MGALVPSASSSKPCILIVDDDNLSLAMIFSAFAGTDYQVFSARRSEDALRIIREERIDVVVAVHYLPGLSGLALLTALRDHMAEPRRILISGRPDRALALAAINEAEVFRFLEKPCAGVTLRLAVYLAHDSLHRERRDRAALEAIREPPVPDSLLRKSLARTASKEPRARLGGASS
ncbi:MAG: response regulator [Deltaproteobacteria bacterium]